MTRTATVALEPAGPRVSKRVPRDVYHAIAGQRVRVGYIVCAAGEPLCGIRATLQPCPAGLFPPQVTCQVCATVAAREGISIIGTEPGK